MKTFLPLTIILSLFLLLIPPAMAEAPDSVDRLVLQQYLSVVEVKQSLEAIKKEQAEIEASLKQYAVQKNTQQQEADELFEKSGRVLAAYYTGERTSWLEMIFSVKKMRHGMLVIEYINELFSRDMEELHRANEAHERLLATEREIKQRSIDLAQQKAQYEAQTARLQALNSSVNGTLAQMPERERLELLMKQLEQDWQTNGKPAFQMFFRHLSKTVKDMPTLIDSRHFTKIGLSPAISITDEEINELLVKDNPLFKNITFTFRDGELWVQGSYGETVLTVVGTFVKKSEKALVFRIRQMTYDGYNLPPSTVNEMSRSVDMGIYPGAIHRGITIHAFSIEDHRLSLQMKLSLFH